MHGFIPNTQHPVVLLSTRKPIPQKPHIMKEVVVYVKRPGVRLEENPLKLEQVAASMRSISSRYVNTLKALPVVSGQVTLAVFEECLAIYENNQDYYLEHCEKEGIEVSKLAAEINALERWFMDIIEPEPVDERDMQGWRERVVGKYKTSTAGYCAPQFLPVLTPLEPRYVKFYRDWAVHLGVIKI